jgi:hypothetical protein
MVVRVFLLLAVIVAVLYLVEALQQLRQGAAGAGYRAGSRPSRGAPQVPGSRLIACDECGVHVPASRMLRGEVRGSPGVFCSPACRRAVEDR